jgi:hypothetical protein
MTGKIFKDILASKTEEYIILFRDDYFWFDLIFIRKNNQTGFFRKNQNQFKPTSFGSVILEQKSVFSVWLVFLFGSVFSI